MRGAVFAAVLGLGLAVLGGLFDAEPLFVGGVAFAVLGVVSGVWVWLAARGAWVERELAVHRVVENEPFDVRLRARAALPVPGGELVEPLLTGPVPLRAGRRETRIRVHARFARRGLRRLDAPRLEVHDPLRLAVKAARGGAGTEEVLVLPRIEPVEVRSEPDASGSGRSLAALAGMAEVEMDGLRAYRPGTPASRIHWAPLARGAGLLERRLRPDGDGRPLVVLDPRGGSADDLDAAVRAAASLCHALASGGGCGLLLPGERRAARVERDLRAWPAAWARLALVENTAPPPLAGLASRIGPIFFVAAAPPARIPRALQSAPGLRVLVVPTELPGRQEVLTVAGCHGYALARTGARVARAVAARGTA
jgi:uncharacterized protein (DUF58 family)